MTAEHADVSEDAVLGGRLVLRQPRRGHRFGHDSILLAAAVAARPGEHAIELGAGVGAAGLALARRIEGLTVTLVEIDPMLAALARQNAERNSLAARVRSVCLDVTAPAVTLEGAGLESGSADHVLMNPPFNASHNPSPDRGRRLARVAASDTLQQWLRTAARLLRPSGTVTLIWRADGVADVLAALAAAFGAVTLLPIHPKPDAPAMRVLARAAKGAKVQQTELPGLILAEADGKPTAESNAILRQGAALNLTGR
jgi:tRNA1(Val) A37 N6-methylase TrmN6